MIKAKHKTINKNIFKNINSKNFFINYATSVKNYNHKIRGKDGNGKDIYFSKDDIKEIKKGIGIMAKDIIQQLKQLQ